MDLLFNGEPQSGTVSNVTSNSFTVSRSLDRNPLECGCAAMWLRRWFRDHSLRGPVICGSPDDLQGMDLLQLSPDNFCSRPLNHS